MDKFCWRRFKLNYVLKSGGIIYCCDPLSDKEISASFLSFIKSTYLDHRFAVIGEYSCNNRRIILDHYSGSPPVVASTW